MTTINSENEHDSSRAGQTSSSSAPPNSGHVEHQNNGQEENGYNIDINDNQQTGSSQVSANGNGVSMGSKPEDDRKLFVGMLEISKREKKMKDDDYDFFL